MAVSLIAIGLGGLLAPGSPLRCVLFNEVGWTDDFAVNVLKEVLGLLSCAAVGAGLGAPFQRKRLGACVGMVPWILWLLSILQIGMGSGR